MSDEHPYAPPTAEEFCQKTGFDPAYNPGIEHYQDFLTGYFRELGALTAQIRAARVPPTAQDILDSLHS